MSNAAGTIDRQVAAYNAHDIGTFAACYAEDVVIVDAAGTELTRGRAQLVEQYRRWFARTPELHADVLSRIEVDAYVIDEELVTGTADGDLRAVAIYHVTADRLIDR